MIQPASAPTHPSLRGSEVGEAAATRSVGHSARAAVQVARDDGIDLPRNAQGMAARAIARGADPQSVFAGLATPPVADGAGDGEASGGIEDPEEAAVGSAPLGAGAADMGQDLSLPTGMSGGDAAGADDADGAPAGDTAIPDGSNTAEANALAALSERSTK